MPRFTINIHVGAKFTVASLEAAKLNRTLWWLVFKALLQNQHAQLVRHSHIGCICLTFPHCVLGIVRHWLHLFDFSPLCVKYNFMVASL